MKTLTKTFALAAFAFSSISIAHAAPELVAADDYVTTKICMVASEGNKGKLSSTIKKAGLTKRYVADHVKCNDLTLVNFIEQYGSNVENMNNFLTGGEYSNSNLVANVASR